MVELLAIVDEQASKQTSWVSNDKSVSSCYKIEPFNSFFLENRQQAMDPIWLCKWNQILWAFSIPFSPFPFQYRDTSQSSVFPPFFSTVKCSTPPQEKENKMPERQRTTLCHPKRRERELAGRFEYYWASSTLQSKVMASNLCVYTHTHGYYMLKKGEGRRR